MTTSSAPPPQLTFDPNLLPLAQLESLKFKASQLTDSIYALLQTLEAQNALYMPPWPDILAKYNIILSQAHSFASGLRVAGPSLALHPSVGLNDAQLDNEVVPLLRNQQTTDVLRSENACVKRLAEHMETKGSLGVLGMSSTSARTDYPAVLSELAQIRTAHDARVERAVRAVTMLRDKFEWRPRVEVEVEEPEEIEWERNRGDVAGGEDVEMDVENGLEGEEGQSSDEDAVEEELDQVEMDADPDADVEGGTPSMTQATGTPGSAAP